CYNLFFFAVLEPMTSFDNAPTIGRRLSFPSVISNEAEGGKIWLFSRADTVYSVILRIEQLLAFSAVWQGVNTLFVLVYAKC
ncbi:hypothetical protein PSY31_23705, partial [Shigella flexneri]|nr:hypothetical protein [Shigella flexneri]